jgi:ubiquinone/menaquinone biosynthesis C-methylase UbiE
MPSDLDSLNQRFYQNATIADWYATKDFILPEEQAFLDAYGAEALHGKSILDIGIGAGRTTRFLLPRTARYVGVDYSPDMITMAGTRFPGVNLEVRDARDLSAYQDSEFDTVIFSFNGMDCLSHEGRMAALSEIVRVLKPGGWFGFSAHNRGRAPASAFSLSNLSFSKHPVRMARNASRYLRGVLNWLRSRSLAMQTSEYALRHDSGNIFEVPMYYIDKPQQAAQLTRLGFELITIINAKGKTTSVDEPDASSPWIFFAARKGTSTPV